MQREFPSVPLVGVGALIFDDDKVLLIRRAQEPMKGSWSIPGGMLELGESLREGVHREVREETGLLVEPTEIVEVLDRIYREQGRVRYHYVIIDSLCRVTGGFLHAASDAAEVRWAARSEWTTCSELALDSVTVRVLEKAWQKSQALKTQEAQ
jgi:ADP-ribose pyrophosphatase YjhB (NUDIX family)